MPCRVQSKASTGRRCSRAGVRAIAAHIETAAAGEGAYPALPYCNSDQGVARKATLEESGVPQRLVQESLATLDAIPSVLDAREDLQRRLIEELREQRDGGGGGAASSPDAVA